MKDCFYEELAAMSEKAVFRTIMNSRYGFSRGIQLGYFL